MWVLPLHHLITSSNLSTKLLISSLEVAEETGAQKSDITSLKSEGTVGLEALTLSGICPLLYATSLAYTSCMTLSKSLSYSETQSPHL